MTIPSRRRAATFRRRSADAAATGDLTVVGGVARADGAWPHRAVRLELFGEDDAGRFSPLTLGRGRRAPVAPVATASHAVALGEGAE